MFKLLLIGLYLIGQIQQVLVAPSVGISLLHTLRIKPHADVIITMRDSPTSLLNQVKSFQFQDRSQKLSVVALSLKLFAASSQEKVLKYLEEAKAKRHGTLDVTFLWISNQIAVRGADLDVVRHLTTMEDIGKIEEDFYLEIGTPGNVTVIHTNENTREDEVQWGVKQIQAPKVWETGNRGDGIVVATFDTGVRYTHEALRDNFVGDYGWYDPFNKVPTPYDTIGHGTHTTANIAGRARNVGVAPNVKWATCKGCDIHICSAIDLLACGQWAACPHLADGTSPDCSKAPHIVSNSWGGAGGNDWYDSVIEYYHAVGIIPVFSVGNAGPQCGSVGSPGDSARVIGVGSTTIQNILSDFSGVGPTKVGGRIKPDVAGPGSNVFSAYFSSDTSYATYSGTSIAAPHAAGVIALLLSEDPNLTYEDIKRALQSGSVPTTSSGLNCGDIPEDVYPNHHVGHGRIDAFNSVVSARSMRKRQILQ